MLALAGSSAGASTQPQVVATGLDNPRKLTVGADGSLYVVEAGHGGRDRCLGTGASETCVGLSGDVARIANGKVTRVVTGLWSGARKDGTNGEGPAAVLVGKNRYDVLLQDSSIDRHGFNRLGPDGVTAGTLIETPPGKASPAVLFNFAAFEAARNPDHGAGPGARFGDPPIDSDPYALAAYRGGFAVADAAGNDLLWVKGAKVRVLAVFPTQRVRLAASTAKRLHVRAGTVLAAQAVPDSVAVGPDGALYVGELTGVPFAPGTARVWRVVPGRRPTVYARGFTNISDLAWHGRDLLVLEISARGFLAGSVQGALIRVAPGGRRTTIASKGLVEPAGLAVAGGRAYVSNYGTSPTKGEVVAYGV